MYISTSASTPTVLLKDTLLLFIAACALQTDTRELSSDVAIVLSKRDLGHIYILYLPMGSQMYACNISIL